MQTGYVTTPFGRRPMTLALVKRQISTIEAGNSRPVDKWKVFRDICEARAVLGVQDRALAVLDALLTFHPAQDIGTDGGTVVFPSNAQLSVRAHGIAGTTLRRQLGVLVDAGLIIRRDSPNGKRYARKDKAGGIESAFGFDLSPLRARADEFARLAQSVAAEKLRFSRAKEDLSICRRDVRKLISAAIDEGAAGDWAVFEDMYIALCGRIPRSPTLDQLLGLAEEMAMLRAEVLNRMEIQIDSEKTDANDVHNGRHIQNSKPDYINELEPSSGKEQGAMSGNHDRSKREPVPIKNFPLGMVLRACPEIGMYGPGGSIGSWRDMMGAAVVIRSMLGVSPSAYQEACEVMGAENAATAIACILERAGHINSAGGYLRDLTRKAARDEFSLGPMLMALLKANGGSAQKAG